MKLPERIAVFIHSMNGGGSERQVSYLVNELSQYSHVSLITLDSGAESAYELDPKVQRVGLGLLISSSGWWSGLRANQARIHALRQLLINVNPSVLVSFCDSNNILALMAAKKLVRVIISERSDPRYQRMGFLRELMRNRIYPRCDRCIVQTNKVGQYFEKRGCLRSNQWSVIPSAVQCPTLDFVEASSQREASQEKRLIFVGRLSSEKRVDRLIEAWAVNKQSEAARTWRLVIVGDGPLRRELQELARQKAVSDSIDWKYWTNDVWSELLKSHAYTLVSRYEGFPQSMLEAMSSGLAVAVMDCSPAVRETIDDGVHGLVIADESKLAAAILQLMADEPLRRRLGKAAHARSQQFQWTNIAPLWHQALSIR
jgi:GalNAc-alpha-(1->4)-GalNAc-alpha-(1->3)-diNAcBac-PP-undecaprenol alpha-1,4-N-acetyl-D-galactosaminyltransferase